MEAAVLFFVVATLVNGATAELGPFKSEAACNVALQSPLVMHFGVKAKRIECVRRISL